MAVFSYKNPASARISHDSCCSEGQKGTLKFFKSRQEDAKDSTE